MKYALDFDGTLAKRNGIPTRTENIEDLVPMEGAVEAVKWLLACGHELYVFTNNKYPQLIEQWLSKNGLPVLRVTNIKESGTKAYIDDRAIRFTSWQDIRKLLE